jgi:hypothetical protein
MTPLKSKNRFDTGYKGQHRLFLRWQRELTAMRLHARAQGDNRAQMDLSGILAPGILYRDGSTWVLVTGLGGRKEKCELTTGKVLRHVKRRRRPDGTYFGERQGRSVCLLKSRGETRHFGAGW